MKQYEIGQVEHTKNANHRHREEGQAHVKNRSYTDNEVIRKQSAFEPKVHMRVDKALTFSLFGKGDLDAVEVAVFGSIGKN